MKTAEEWIAQNENCGKEDSEGNLLPYEYTITDIKLIQLDAMKEGMRRAAQLSNRLGLAYDNAGCIIAEQNILTAADQLTEKDLEV